MSAPAQIITPEDVDQLDAIVARLYDDKSTAQDRRWLDRLVERLRAAQAAPAPKPEAGQ